MTVTKFAQNRNVAPLYAAGFTTAFGAHSIAAGLGAEQSTFGSSLLTLGILLAVYDVAEVVLKPIFGSLSDRVGAKPVIIGGLLGFCLMSTIGIFATTPLLIGLARLGQGAAASAFSPASSAAVARLAGAKNTGKFFGRYGSWKTLGYVLGPLLGAGLIWLGGFPALFLSMTIVSAAAAVWVFVSMPSLPTLPKQRYTLRDLIRQSTERAFIIPTLALAAATGALGTAIGFLPLIGSNLELNTTQSMGVVSVLAVVSALVQPWIGKIKDEGKLSTSRGISLGLLSIAVGLATVSLAPSLATLITAALFVGFGVGVTTPLGFSHLASSTPEARMGRTMGSAELGREVGDAGGPLLVGAIATAAGVSLGIGVLAVIVAGVASVCVLSLRKMESKEVQSS